MIQEPMNSDVGKYGADDFIKNSVFISLTSILEVAYAEYFSGENV